MIKGHQHVFWVIFLYKGPLASEGIPVFKFGFCPSPLVMWGVGRMGECGTLVAGEAGDQSSLLCTWFGCMTCGFGPLSLRITSLSC